MAKITRKRLARGTKLSPDHVTAPLAAAASELHNINIERSQMQAPTAPFCVNLSFPYIGSEVPDGRMTVPFVLPPLQENFATQPLGGGLYNPLYSERTPQTKLKSVSFSFDQRAEPVAIVSHLWNESGTARSGLYGYSSEQGKMSFEDAERLDISLSIHSKDAHIFGDVYPYKLSTPVWSTTIPASALMGASLRANPFIQTDIDITVNPYKTYFFKVECPGLADSSTDRSLCLPGVEVSMKFACELMSRDTGNSIQNIPNRTGAGGSKWGAKTGPTVTVTAPASGTAIEADEPDGVGYNITAIDDEFREKLDGGYDRYADAPPTEVLKHDAAYDVISVPIFQNSAHGGVAAQPTYLATMPYVGTRSALTNGAGIFDRRLIPIHHSYTVHHMVLAWNWTPWSVLLGKNPIDTGVIQAVDQDAWMVAPSANIRLKVGVGIGTGDASDQFGYEELGSITLNDPNNYGGSGTTEPDGWGVASTLIDRITSTPNPPMQRVEVGGLPGTIQKWNWELHSIPVDGVASSQPGYYPQGYPAFVGPGWTNTKERSVIDSAAPNTKGAEQWIEVRANLLPTDSGKSLDESLIPFPLSGPSGTIASMPSLLVGYGGCYVYLICKKSLTR